MASNGSFNTTPHDNRYLTFSWSAYDKSIDGNYTTIYWELRGAGSQTQWFKSGPITLVIDGETVYSSSTRINLDQGTLVASGYKTIYHNNDGSRYFNASASAAIYESTVNCTGGAGWDLDPIPRAAKITSFWDGTTYDFFNDESTPTVHFDNPAGSSVIVRACISWTGGDDIAYRDLSWYERENGYYTFNFTEEERIKLRKAATIGSTSRTVTIYITTYSSNWSIIGYSTREVEFAVANCLPILNPMVIDTGSASTALTNNPETMIRGYNCLYATFNASVPKEGSIISQTVTCGGKTLYGDGYFGDGLTYHVYDNVFVFKVTDNRGQTVEKTVTMPTIDYVPVSVNLNYETDLTENNTTNVKIIISGNYFDGSFGAVDNVLDLQYICRKDGEEYPKDDSGNPIWTKIESTKITLSNNTYSTEINIPDADYKAAYVVQAWVTDKVKGDTGLYAKEQRIKITPVFDWGENDFNFNVPVNFSDTVNLGDPVLLCDSIGVDNTERTFAHGLDVDITLNDSISNYKTIEVLYTANNWDHYTQSVRMRVGYNLGWHTGTIYGNILPTWVPNEYIVFLFPTANTIKVTGAPNTCHIVGIYGWKY